MKVAVIDMGTNTCNLLIAEIGQRGAYHILFQAREGVNLGKGGINAHQLTPEAFNRAKTALQSHLRHIHRIKVDRLFCVATSAVRDADNKNQFCTFLHQATGITLQIISGDQEAGYIFEGVRLAFQSIPDNTLILDIGGGSNEFIISNSNRPAWKHSFPLGMSRVIEHIRLSNPITSGELHRVISYFDSGLSQLWQQTAKTKIDQLIGCAGAFNTLCDLIDNVPPQTKVRRRQEISLFDFQETANRVIHSSREQRSVMTGMDPLRIQLIVPALIFIRLIVERLQPARISQTDYSLREGVLNQLLID